MISLVMNIFSTLLCEIMVFQRRNHLINIKCEQRKPSGAKSDRTFLPEPTKDAVNEEQLLRTTTAQLTDAPFQFG